MTVSSVINSSRDSDSSTGEINSPSEERMMKRFVKSMVKGSLFIGTFVEKRYVPDLGKYRHVVKISDQEVDVIKHLKVATKRIKDFYLIKKWIGFTDRKCVGAPVGYNLWTTLDEEKFGTYWYKIQHVSFQANEVEFKLQIVRPYTEKPFNQTYSSSVNNKTEVNQSWFSDSVSEVIKSNLKYFASEIITFENIKNTSTFLILLTATVITGSAHVIQYLLDFSLKLMREMQGIIKVLTPTFLACINLLTKTIGGLYLLIAVLWRDRHGPPPTQQIIFNSDKNFGYSPQAYRALPSASYNPNAYNNYYNRNNQTSGVRITPLN